MVAAKRCCFCGKAARSNAPKTKLLNSLDGLKEASASECTAHVYHLICMCGRVSVSQSVSIGLTLAHSLCPSTSHSQCQLIPRPQSAFVCLSLLVNVRVAQLRYDQLMTNFRGTGIQTLGSISNRHSIASMAAKRG